jgi:hypothetical protein
MRVARYYCRDAQRTFSLLPDCLSSRLTGSLDEAEQVVVRVEESRSLEEAASAVRPDLNLPGAIRWVQRRRQGLRAALLALITLLPGRLGTTAELQAVRSTLGTERALVALREIASAHLHALLGPLGFRPARRGSSQPEHRLQHKTGADPPRRLRY